MTTRNPIWHPFTQHGLGQDEIAIASASGARLTRTDGRTLIDAIASWWVITHGHCHPAIAQAVQAQAETLDQIIFAGFTHAPAQTLARTLLAQSFDTHAHVFFSDSGSTAVEVGLKMAIGYWQHTGRARTKILALEGAYHGDTFATMATGARGAFNAIYEPFMFDVIHTPVPIAGDEDRALSVLDATLAQHGEEIAAFVFEPLLQGSGGMRMYSPAMLAAMCDVCKRYGIILLADEVMTGFGRTGSLFACAQAGVRPDLMAVSKGLTGGFLPMGATLATADIYDAFYDTAREKMFFHSSSFTGNPLACAAANASLALWDDPACYQNITRIQRHHAQALLRFQALRGVTNVRQCGTILALDYAPDGASGYFAQSGQDFYRFALSRGVLLRALGSVIYVMPPYCISDGDLATVYDCIEAYITKGQA